MTEDSNTLKGSEKLALGPILLEKIKKAQQLLKGQHNLLLFQKPTKKPQGEKEEVSKRDSTEHARMDLHDIVAGNR